MLTNIDFMQTNNHTDEAIKSVLETTRFGHELALRTDTLSKAFLK